MPKITYKTKCKDPCQLRSPVTNRCVRPPSSPAFMKLKRTLEADPRAGYKLIRKKQRLSKEQAADVAIDWIMGPAGIPSKCIDSEGKKAMRKQKKEAKNLIPEGYKSILKKKKKATTAKAFLNMKKVHKPKAIPKITKDKKSKAPPKKKAKLMQDIAIESVGKAPKMEIDADSMPNIFDLTGLPAMAAADPLEHQTYLCGYMAKSGITRMLFYHGTGTGKTISALYATHCLLTRLKEKNLIGHGKVVEHVLIIAPTANSAVFKEEQANKVLIAWPKEIKVDYITHSEFARDMAAKGGKRKYSAAYYSKSIIIIDEAHEYSVPPEVAFKKMPAKVKYIFRATQHAPFVFLLTATPTQNYPSDFVILHMILANREGDRSIYDRYYKLKTDLDALRASSDGRDFKDFMHEFKKAVNVPDKWHALLHDVQCQISLLRDSGELMLPLVCHDKHMMPDKFRFYEKNEHIKKAVIKLNDSILHDKGVNAFKINERQLSSQIVIPGAQPIFSEKMKSVAKYAMMIASTGRKVVIYCDLVGSGADAAMNLLKQYKTDPALKPSDSAKENFTRDDDEMGKFFEKERRHIAKKKDKKALDMSPKPKKTSGTLPLLTGYDFSDIEVSIITGSVSGKVKKAGELSERSRVVKKFNDEIAADGSVKDRKKMKKVIIISSAAARSLELKNTSVIFLLQPPWSYATYQQAIGRVIRNKSHSALPEEFRNVAVYRCSSVVKDPKTGSDISVDDRIYQLYKMKKLANRYFRHELKELSVETSLENHKTSCYSPKRHGKKSPKVFMKEIRE